MPVACKLTLISLSVTCGCKLVMRTLTGPEGLVLVDMDIRGGGLERGADRVPFDWYMSCDHCPRGVDLLNGT